ncbi:flagellar hook-associated protein FlgK [Alicyclobacillus fastidiosus]|uniref:Flagellar hook-associated protein 1 n=1 Tax=Alicyclobacillus fastidiosus TaxID=392011 RepID=A0ABV5AKV4_9BACL|nr:flagellar hook-associated protein FlgK [Alicyclobacillus fastidiosus]WEH10248.1 flagellar hook-associated protein FlgK [Alicyclobacillus fastidiosus]
MLGTFLGLQTSFSGLEAAQAGINTVSHNISNANTAGYSREVVDYTENQALSLPGVSSSMLGQVGQGANVEQIQRVQSDFLDDQYRQQNASLSQANVEQSTLNEVSGIIDEPSSTGISSALQQFYQSWDTLGSNPSELSSRTAVVDAAQTLTDVMNQTANQLGALNTSVTTSLSDSVTQVNSLLSQIAGVSNQIAQIQQTGNQPNDLMDQRDNLLDQLSQYTTFQTSITPASSGSVSYDQFTLTLTGSTTASGNTSTAPVTVIDGTQTDFKNDNPPTNLVGKLAIAGDTGAVKIVPESTTSSAGTALDGSPDLTGQGGQIQGYQDSLSDVQSYQNELDVLAQSLAGAGTTTLNTGWTIPASAINSPPYNSMTFTANTPGATAQSAADFVQGLTPNNGSYTIPAGTTVTTSLGGMSVTLQGQMDFSSTTKSEFGNLNIQVPGGSQTTLSDYMNANPTATSLPAGTTVQVTGLNQLLELGYSETGPGQAMFGSSASSNGQPITASNITVLTQASDLAAGTTAQDPTAATPVAVSGDGTLATLISNLSNNQMSFPSPLTTNGGTSSTLTGTLSDYLTSVVGQLGLQGQEANNNVTVQTSLTQQLTTQRQSVSGVSIDEEMTNMISYQQAYNASSKMISTLNDMLTQLMQNV